MYVYVLVCPHKEHKVANLGIECMPKQRTQCMPYFLPKQCPHNPAKSTEQNVVKVIAIVLSSSKSQKVIHWSQSHSLSELVICVENQLIFQQVHLCKTNLQIISLFQCRFILIRFIQCRRPSFFLRRPSYFFNVPNFL